MKYQHPQRWDRLAFAFHTRPNRAPRDINRADLAIPQGPGGLKMLVVTLGCGLAVAAMFVWPVLTLISILSGQPPGNWYWGTLLAAAVVVWLGLFKAAVHESAADRRYAQELHRQG